MSNGVRYLDADGNAQTIMLNTSGEIIIAAGALATPLILEASGVGSQSHLNKLGIDVRVDLPGVGENLQDQPDLTLSYPSKQATPGVFTPYAAFLTAQDVFGDKTKDIEASTKASLRAWATIIASSSQHASVDAIESIFCHQHDLIFKDKVAIAEITMTSSETLASEYWTLLPFSRGSVHIQSLEHDGTYKAAINPRFFQIEHDLNCFTTVSRLTQKFWATDPAKGLVADDAERDDSVPQENATDEEWFSFIQKNTIPNCHVLGTAAMMSRELGGVVDAELKVYDTRNVRVVDASIIPLQVTGHLASTIYAIAARAADLILEAKPVSNELED